MAAFDRGEQMPEPNIACRLWSDPVLALLTGIRSALAVGITSTFWFATAWRTDRSGGGRGRLQLACLLRWSSRTRSAWPQPRRGLANDIAAYGITCNAIVPSKQQKRAEMRYTAEELFRAHRMLTSLHLKQQTILIAGKVSPIQRDRVRELLRCYRIASHFVVSIASSSIRNAAPRNLASRTVAASD
jgi:hypothetical protein